MKIRILGSGGGEGYPAMFCSCDNCNAARKVGGKNIRTLSQTLINDDLLIDFGAESSLHSLRYGINFGDIPYVLITHTHQDHFVPQAFYNRGGVYAHNIKARDVSIIGSSDVKKVFDTVMSVYGINIEILNTMHFPELLVWETRAFGQYNITALPARHAKGLIPYNYIISNNDKALLYLHDTGYPSDDTLEFLKSFNRTFNCVFMDATMGVGDNNYYGHMGFNENMRLKNKLSELGLADENTVFAVNHITHNRAPLHDKIEEIFKDTGIIVAYDGMIIEI